MPASNFMGQGLQGGSSEMMSLKEENRCLKDAVVDGLKNDIQFLKNEKLVRWSPFSFGDGS